MLVRHHGLFGRWMSESEWTSDRRWEIVGRQARHFSASQCFPTRLLAALLSHVFRCN